MNTVKQCVIQINFIQLESRYQLKSSLLFQLQLQLIVNRKELETIFLFVKTGKQRLSLNRKKKLFEVHLMATTCDLGYSTTKTNTIRIGGSNKVTKCAAHQLYWHVPLQF